MRYPVVVQGGANNCLLGALLAWSIACLEHCLLGALLACSIAFLKHCLLGSLLFGAMLAWIIACLLEELPSDIPQKLASDMPQVTAVRHIINNNKKKVFTTCYIALKHGNFDAHIDRV